MSFLYVFPIRYTFIHFADGAKKPCRSKSAPPRISFSVNICIKTKRKHHKKRKRRTAHDDDVAVFRECASQNRCELWAKLVREKNAQSDAAGRNWIRMTIANERKHSQPVLRATLTGRAFTHMLQYGMKNAVDLLQFHTSAILRKNQANFEIWASDAFAQSTKVANLIAAAKLLTRLLDDCKIMLHMPDHKMFVLTWRAKDSISTLQENISKNYGIPFEKQKLQLLRQDLDLNGTFSSAGVLPGDVIDCIEIWNSKEEINEERHVTRLGTLIVA